jgi:hypothetical protein
VSEPAGGAGAEDRPAADGPNYHTPNYGTPPSPWASPDSSSGSTGSQATPQYQPAPRFDPPPRPVQSPPGYGAPAYGPPPGYGPPGYGAPGYGPVGYPPAPGPVSPGYGGPAYGMPGYGVQPAAAPVPIRVDVIEGTQFGVAYPTVPPTPSGPSIGSMVAGIVSILISFVVGCFGLVGSTDGWGPAVSGAFAILAAFIGAGAIGMGFYGLRQIRRGSGTVRGRGMAIAGISCGGSGIGLTVLMFLLAVLATAGSTTG